MLNKKRKEYIFGKHNEFFTDYDYLKILDYGSHSENFKEWSKSYFHSAVFIFKKIKDKNDKYNNNEYNDRVSIPMLFLFRHSLELTLKSILADQNTDHDFLQIIQKEKHDLYGLYKHLNKDELDSEVKIFLKDYLKDVNTFDKGSSLFRFPYNDYFRDKKRNNYLDHYSMALTIYIINIILFKTYFDISLVGSPDGTLTIKELYQNLIKINPKQKYLIRKNHGIGYMYTFSIYTGDSFPQTEGYLKAAELLYEKIRQPNITNKEKLLYFSPMVFCYRNVVELMLKSWSTDLHDYYHEEIKIKSPKFKSETLKGHDLNKRIWTNNKHIFKFVSESFNWKGISSEDVQKYFIQISIVDKESYNFRYPITKNGEYLHNDKYNPENIHMFMRELIDLLQGIIYGIEEMDEYVGYIIDSIYY